MKAKDLILEKWVNGRNPFSIQSASMVTMIEFFQIRCPACVQYAIPQTAILYKELKESVNVFGIHSVFEDHEEQNEASLNRFLSDNDIPFPVAIDKHLGESWLPETMKAYQIQGTPTTVVIDMNGNIRLHHLGVLATGDLKEFLLMLTRERT